MRAPPTGSTGDWRFHRAPYESAGRARQLEMIEHLRGTVARFWSVRDVLPTNSAEWLADHQAIVEACRARSSVAVRRPVEDHLRRAMELVLARSTGSAASSLRPHGAWPHAGAICRSTSGR